jgi:hypothetical protein
MSSIRQLRAVGASLLRLVTTLEVKAEGGQGHIQAQLLAAALEVEAEAGHVQLKVTITHLDQKRL